MGRTPDIEQRDGRPGTSRRGALKQIGKIVGGASLIGIASTGPPTFVGAAAPPTPNGQVRPMVGHPELLPPGVKARPVRAADSCSPDAEYVGSNICVDGFCCAGNMYRQQCLDGNGNPYYNYFCA